MLHSVCVGESERASEREKECVCVRERERERTCTGRSQELAQRNAHLHIFLRAHENTTMTYLYALHTRFHMPEHVFSHTHLQGAEEEERGAPVVAPLSFRKASPDTAQDLAGNRRRHAVQQR